MLVPFSIAFRSTGKSFASRVEESAVLSANSLIDQLAVKVSVNVIRSWRHRVVVKTTMKSPFEMQWWASKRLSLELKVTHYVRLVSLLQYCYGINRCPFDRKKMVAHYMTKTPVKHLLYRGIISNLFRYVILFHFLRTYTLYI